jgi:uncharacterized membrane protein
MKRYLILGVFTACAVCDAGPPAPVRTPPAKPAAEVKPPATGPRHLSEAQRAELRRQLEEFNRRYDKSAREPEPHY